MSKKNKEEKHIEDEAKNASEQAETATATEEKTEEVSVEDQLKEQVQQEKDKYLRLFAEFENYKKRTSRERIELLQGYLF